MGPDDQPGVPFAPRQVAPGGGRALVVRPVTPGDVAGLAALYAGLGVDDRHRRFFSAYRPSEEFLEWMANVAERGGFGLVAVVTEPNGGEQQIVGEAGYSLLPDGDGEFAITVAA